MKDKDKLKLLQQVGNEVVDTYGATDPLLLEHAVKALEIILVGISARNTPVVVAAITPDEILEAEAGMEQMGFEIKKSPACSRAKHSSFSSE